MAKSFAKKYRVYYVVYYIPMTYIDYRKKDPQQHVWYDYIYCINNTHNDWYLPIASMYGIFPYVPYWFTINKSTIHVGQTYLGGGFKHF